MTNRKFLIAIIPIFTILMLLACSTTIRRQAKTIAHPQETGKIYLYGESHGVKKIIEKEFELWYDSYHNEDMRHLFVELPYYTAEFLNIWMQSDSNEILEELYTDWGGALGQVPEAKEFYKKIKVQCPETIFHGTDVGHQYYTTGKRFLEYLKEKQLEDSEQYILAQEAVEQGRYYREKSDHIYRENKMVENFIREFDKLSGESIMGIYGAAHIQLEGMDYYTKSVPCMANQLKQRYENNMYVEDLSVWVKDIEPYRIDTIKVNQKEYEALYFGETDLTKFNIGYKYCEFWRLENAYNEFKNMPKTEEVLPYENYPMLIEKRQVFVIDYTKIDDSIERRYYRSDGRIWNDLPSTEAFIPE